MYTKQPKKLLIVNILDILRKYTDENHRLSQKDIGDILRKEYDMVVDRKAIRRNILNLIDSGYDISYKETVRMMPSKDKKTDEVVMEENIIMSDFYMIRQFTDGELRLVIDGLLFSKHVPYSQCKELVEKLESLSSVYFRSRVAHISRLPGDQSDNSELFYNIELLDEAISKGRKIAFKYIEYGTDKKVHVKKRPDGTVREYIINPYQMAAKDGKYYLICNYEKYDDISNYRIDRIRDIRILDEPVKPYENLCGSDGKRLDLAEYMREHVYMYASKNSHIKLRVRKTILSDVIDVFGKDIRFYDEDEEFVSVSAKANEMAVEQFAKYYSPNAVILEPRYLVDKLVSEMEETLGKYKVMKG